VRLALLALLLVIALPGQPAAAEQQRYVPQLGLVSLEPLHVEFSPVDPNLLLVVNIGGWIDLLDIGDTRSPVKTTEIFASAATATLSPDGTRIVSRGEEGTVRLWQLGGTPTAQPFDALQSDPLPEL
jgi:hypothetical protein